MPFKNALRHAVIALMLLGTAHRLAAQVSFVTMPDAAEQAAARRKLRRVEARFVPRLRRSHGDPAVGAQLGEALRAIRDERLDRPSPALTAQVKAARDPYALALAIVDDVEHFGDSTSYEIDVLLTALERPASAAQKATLWAKAAAIERRDLALRLAFLERAYDILSGIPPSATWSCELDTDLRQGGILAPNPCMVASRQLEEMLDAGLSREALATFDALPGPLRELLFVNWAEPSSTHADRRLSLVAARLLEADPEGARALLARIQIAPWRAAPDSVADGTGPSDPSAVWRAVLERWLDAPAGDDAFPLLAKFVAADLFGPGRQAWGVAVASYASLADRESYPEIARYAWRKAAGTADDEKDTNARVPPTVAPTAQRLRTALAARSRLDEDSFRASARAASATPRPHVKCQVDCDRLDLEPALKLLALDHRGKTGIAILENYPFFGDLFQIEIRDGGLFAVRIADWIS